MQSQHNLKTPVGRKQYLRFEWNFFRYLGVYTYKRNHHVKEGLPRSISVLLHSTHTLQSLSNPNCTQYFTVLSMFKATASLFSTEMCDNSTIWRHKKHHLDIALINTTVFVSKQLWPINNNYAKMFCSNCAREEEARAIASKAKQKSYVWSRSQCTILPCSRQGPRI